MKRSEHETDRLTRALMQESIEKPSPGLNSRIMAFIKQSAPQKKAFEIKKPLSIGRLFLLFIIYMLLLVGGVVLIQTQDKQIVELSHSIKELFPLFITVAGGISFFILFGLLDKWLQQNGYKIPEE